MTAAPTWSPPLGAERAQEVCDAALRLSDADHTEVAVLARRGEHTRFAGDRIHQAQDITEWSVWVRAVAGGGTGRAMTSDLDDLETTVRRAVLAARGDAGPAVAVNAAAEEPPTDTDLWDPEVAAFDAGVRSELARRAVAAGQDIGAEVAGVVSRAVTEMAVATSASHASALVTSVTMPTAAEPG